MGKSIKIWMGRGKNCNNWKVAAIGEYLDPELLWKTLRGFPFFVIYLLYWNELREINQYNQVFIVWSCSRKKRIKLIN